MAAGGSRPGRKADARPVLLYRLKEGGDWWAVGVRRALSDHWIEG